MSGLEPVIVPIVGAVTGFLSPYIKDIAREIRDATIPTAKVQEIRSDLDNCRKQLDDRKDDYVTPGDKVKWDQLLGHVLALANQHTRLNESRRHSILSRITTVRAFRQLRRDTRKLQQDVSSSSDTAISNRRAAEGSFNNPANPPSGAAHGTQAASQQSSPSPHRHVFSQSSRMVDDTSNMNVELTTRTFGGSDVQLTNQSHRLCNTLPPVEEIHSSSSRRHGAHLRQTSTSANSSYRPLSPVVEIHSPTDTPAIQDSAALGRNSPASSGRDSPASSTSISVSGGEQSNASSTCPQPSTSSNRNISTNSPFNLHNLRVRRANRDQEEERRQSMYSTVPNPSSSNESIPPSGAYGNPLYWMHLRHSDSQESNASGT